MLEDFLHRLGINFQERLLAQSTTFRVGGKVSHFISPRSIEEWIHVTTFLYQEKIPFFVLGEGSNVLASDTPMDIPFISTLGLQKVKREGTLWTAEAGTKVRDLCEKAYLEGHEGLSFIYGMPGTIGGAVWMNARCYDGEISEIFHSARVMDRSGISRLIHRNEVHFAYKDSLFQREDLFILEVTLQLHEAPKESIHTRMQKHLADRTAKGHFRFPCAGSIFKNNRAFGKPSGQLIDEAGLKALSLGGAQIAPWHGNIIINRHHATAWEIYTLITYIEDTLKKHSGIELQRELILLGSFS